MKQFRLTFHRALMIASASSVFLLSSCNNGFNSAPATSTTVQQSLYSKIGIGAALGPHFDDYLNYNNDTLNAVYQSFVGKDINQLNHYGFNTVRLYGDTAYTYISAIQNLPANMKLVYQYSLCQSDASVGGLNSPCYNVPYTNLGQIEVQETAKLQQVIQAVGAATFQDKVSMVIVGNEDLTEPKGAKGVGPFNNADIVAAMHQVATQLKTLGVSVATQITPSPNGVMLSTSNVVFNAHYVTSVQMNALLSLFTAGSSGPTKFVGPMVFDLYPYQFAGSAGLNITSPTSSGAVSGNYIDSLSGMINGITSSSNCLANGNLDATQCTQLTNAVSASGIMIGETGWANGFDGSIPITPSKGEYMGDFPGNTQAEQNYLDEVLTFAAQNKIPTLLFEAYDQMNKNGADHSDPENHYGIMSWNNIPWITLNNAGIKMSVGDTSYKFDPRNVLLIQPNLTGGLNSAVSSYQVNGGSTQNFNPFHSNSNTAIGVILNSGTNKFNFIRNCNTSGVSLCTLSVTPSLLATGGATIENQSPLPTNAFIGCVAGEQDYQNNGITLSNAAPSSSSGYINSITLGSAYPWSGPGGVLCPASVIYP